MLPDLYSIGSLVILLLSPFACQFRVAYLDTATQELSSFCCFLIYLIILFLIIVKQNHFNDKTRGFGVLGFWGLWLNEIESFSQLPSFFQTFCQDREKETIIYNLIQGQYDCKEETPADGSALSPDALRFIQTQEDLHIEMVKYSYKIVSQVFEQHESAELRESSLKNGTFERFIERIGQLSSEKKRTRVDALSSANAVASISSESPEKKEEVMKKKKSKKEDKTKMRKGVGYTTGVGTAWNVTEYFKSKEAKSTQAANIVNILRNMIKSKDWQAPPEIKTMLLESALLPTLEAAFRSGSLLEMAKEYDLNMAYLSFVQEISNHVNLIDLVLDIGDDYEPRQKDTIAHLLKKMNDLSTIFLGCLTEESKASTDEEQVKPRKLAECIQETNRIVQAKVSEQTEHKKQQSLEDIMSLPLSEAYWKLLSTQRFDYMNMKGTTGVYNHVYSGDFHKATSPPVSKMIRLAQEIADLSNSLPCDYTNAVFCRVDKERVDVMKCMIMGASGTPYAHGAFMYDLFFENSYPNSPPKCQLVTTGGQTVRFNPNLYNNGKVCLSLLGTWRGQSTENWDPKLSTILQVLLSIQAIIMSNEVYFNEPGYEHEAGTPEGEKKNEGYANIVRYCNVKFAIIDAIKNPPPGFEKIIRQSFYLKKNEVLREVKEWVDKAKTSEATYTGLVYDHNYHWTPQLSPEGKYAEMMEKIYVELKETLEALPSPFEDVETGLKIERKFSAAPEDDIVVTAPQQSQQSETISKIEDIDVTYDKNVSQEGGNININDEKVKDRWSRYIGAMGIEAVAKQAESRILISGMGPMGIEIAKNIVLAGCKELILYDDLAPIREELSGQFFITSAEVEDADYTDTRAQFSRDKLQQLNIYVKVTVLDKSIALDEYIEEQGDLKVVVLTDLMQFTTDRLNDINKVCRAKKVAMINVFQNGLFGKIFNDFGEEFIVLDKDGEELTEVMIKDISYNTEKETTIVTLLPGFKHKYEDNDQLIIREVLGMEQEGGKSINEQTVTIKVLTPQSFSIDLDARQYTPYEGNGIAKQIKVPKKMYFKTLEECLKTSDGVPDQNLLISDFEKLSTKQITHYLYTATMNCISNDSFNSNDLSILSEILLKQVQELMPKDLQEGNDKLIANLTHIFIYTYRYSFPPIAAFLGGVASQEIVKAITQKHSPIQQHFYYDCAELYPEQELGMISIEERQKIAQEQETESSRYGGLKACIGKDLLQKIHECKVFMIGAGAIGCELLKNYAMLGLGTQGQIVVTDPDVIEVSNLNRQFLFREKHLRKPKSQTAAAAAVQMNQDLKGHISARLDKIHEGTALIYNEAFFKEQTIITNALDNIQARLFIDGKCVAARTPLLDSGTLGPKGHVQVVIPSLKTESYASQRDPEENGGEIPHCTLKMFPEETLHCVEWAKDMFGQLFTLEAQSFNKVVIEERDQPVNFNDQQEKAALKKVIKMAEKRPKTFDDCLRLSRLRFQKHFVNDIKQLLHVYPLEKLTAEGRPFWSLPKRAPHSVNFDPKNQLHASALASFACLLANLYSIAIPYDQPRSQEQKEQMALKSVELTTIKEFVPSDQKASQIASQVEKEASKKDDTEEDQHVTVMDSTVDDTEKLKSKFESLIAPLRKDQSLKLTVEEFEKDNDENFHVDFIYALANVRASNYRLDEMDWITVKIKAGRIVPALATTTAAIAALQVIELIKYMKSMKIEAYRNSFLNLAVPSLMQSEPGLAEKTKVGDLTVTLWDRWEYEAPSRTVTLLKVVEHLESTYHLSVRDVFYGSIPLYMHALNIGKDRTVTLNQTPLIEQTNLPSDQSFIDLTVTFVDPKATVGLTMDHDTASEKVLEGLPPVRVILPQKK